MTAKCRDVYVAVNEKVYNIQDTRKIALKIILYTDATKFLRFIVYIAQENLIFCWKTPYNFALKFL